MFQNIETLPADPILGLNQQYQKDTNPEKINLSVGVYQNKAGQTPIFHAVKTAEQQLIDSQLTKSYAPQAGDPAFLKHINTLLVGDALVRDLGDRLTTVMTPGGCGALRMGGELLSAAGFKGHVWVSNPTWANHFPLLESAGLSLKTYRYYDPAINRVNFQAMLDDLQQIPEGDVVLLHGCCHNPTGADITPAEWDQVIDVVAQRNLVPFIDVAYQGFGQGLEEDAYGVRLAMSKLPEVMVANSCSKNFGLYRERTGAILVLSESVNQTQAAGSQVLGAARRSYSMSPYHGGGIVGHLLSDPKLTEDWKAELNAVRERMSVLRVGLAEGLNQAQSKINFDFVAKSNGMFCYLGIPKADVLTLRSEFGIYLLENTRINVAGLSEDNLPVIVERVSQVLSR